jgi:hypothetical protein
MDIAEERHIGTYIGQDDFPGVYLTPEGRATRTLLEAPNAYSLGHTKTKESPSK